MVEEFKVRNLKFILELKAKIMEKQKNEEFEDRVIQQEHHIQDHEERIMLEELRAKEEE